MAETSWNCPAWIKIEQVCSLINPQNNVCNIAKCLSKQFEQYAPTLPCQTKASMWMGRGFWDVEKEIQRNEEEFTASKTASK